MEQDNEIAELFADLTALLEDAAALAAEGQRAGLPEHTLDGLVDKIRASLALAAQKAEAVQSRLAR